MSNHPFRTNIFEMDQYWQGCLVSQTEEGFWILRPDLSTVFIPYTAFADLLDDHLINGNRKPGEPEPKGLISS